VLIVGGIHGGYEWNSIVLARRVRDYYAAQPERLPEHVTLLVVPVMNPDGLARVTGGTPIDQFDFSRADTIPGRFNANWVDLNRNWDGDWQPTSYWGRREVDAGSAPFSEPETQAVRDLIFRSRAEVVLFFQSAAAGIWYSGAPQQWLPSRRLAVAYAEESGYALPSTSDDGDSGIDYEITGSASDYLYEQRIPSLTVELSTHQVIEFDRNIAGLSALFRVLRAQ
jgi:predicted deacylase